jgi:biotin carboxylase
VTLLLLAGSGDRRYREYILAAIAPRYQLWLLDTQPPTWQEPYLVGHTVTDVADVPSLVAAARAAAVQAGPVSGLLTYDEWLVEATAAAAAELGLPGPPPSAAAACRDKAATRRLLTAAGVPQPRSVPVGSLPEALAAGDTAGYPVVVKARSMAGSIGVVRADAPAEMAGAYAAAAAPASSRPGAAQPVLVEEYLEGPEISVDCAVAGGEPRIMAVARKQTGLEPYFEETGHTVDAADPLLHDPVLHEMLRRIHQALSFTHGITHSEFRLTADGPRLVEVNARLGGDFIPYLGWLATGVDQARAAADLAAGREPDITPACRRAAGIRFLYPPADCTVRSAAASGQPPPAAVHRALVTAAPGQELLLPPRGYLSRYAYVIALAGTLAEVEETLGKAELLVELDAEPA